MTVTIIPMLLSACLLTGGDKEEVAAVSPTPKVTKAALKPAMTTAESKPKGIKCDDKGFCALPGLKKPKAVE